MNLCLRYNAIQLKQFGTHSCSSEPHELCGVHFGTLLWCGKYTNVSQWKEHHIIQGVERREELFFAYLECNECDLTAVIKNLSKHVNCKTLYALT